MKAASEGRFPPLPGRLSARAVIACAAVASGVGSAAWANPAAADGLSNIRLTATPQVLRADGRSTTYINAEVYDDRGNRVADGTRVRFTTTGGAALLDHGVAVTRSGVARVLLTAPSQPGETFVVAVVEGAGQSVPVQIKITFSTDAEASETGTSWARIDGSQYVGYIADEGVVQANGKNGEATFAYRSLTVSADTLQINVRDNTLRAAGNVTLKQNGTLYTYRSLRFGLMQGEGVGERLDADGIPHYVHLTGTAQVAETPWETGRLPPNAETFALGDLSGAKITIVARSIALEPNNKLQFRRATFYLDGQKTVSLPFHVMAIGQEQLFADQLVGYNAGGVTVDFPLYYDVRPRAVGTLHARRGARLGSGSAFSTRQGWSFDMVQAYNGPRSMDGTVELIGLTRGDWGARLRHGQRLDKQTTGNLYVDFPNNRGLFANTQAQRSYQTWTLNTSLAASRSSGVTDAVTGQKGQAAGDVRGQVYAETRDRAVLPSHPRYPVRFALNTGVTRQSFYGDNGATAVSQGTAWSATTGGRLFTTPMGIARDTSVTHSVSLGQTLVAGTGGQASGTAEGLTILGTTALNRSWGKASLTTLSYNYAQAPQYGFSSATSALAGRHRVDLTAFLTPSSSWDVSLTGSRGLDSPQSTLFGRLGVVLGGSWKAQARFSTSQIAGVGYKELEYGLFRKVLGKELGVYYSATSKRFQLDLSKIGF